MPAAVALAIFVPWMVRDWLVFGNPLPGQALSNALSVTGFDIFAWNDPPTLKRYLAEGPAAPAADARRRPRPQPLHGPAAAGDPGRVPRPDRAAVVHPPSGDPAARGPVDHDVPGHEPAVPRFDDVGDVPPCRGAGPRPPHRLRAAGARRRDRARRADPRLDAAGRLARRGADDLRVAPVHGGADALVRRPVAGPRPALRGARSRDGCRRHAARRPGPDHHELPDLALGGNGRPGAGTTRREPGGRARPREDLQGDQAADRPRRRSRRLAGESSTRRSRARNASTKSISGPRPILGSLGRWRIPACSGWSVHEWRPLYSEADGRSTDGSRNPRRGRARGARPARCPGPPRSARGERSVDRRAPRRGDRGRQRQREPSPNASANATAPPTTRSWRAGRR